jgi:hypothetical protein
MESSLLTRLVGKCSFRPFPFRYVASDFGHAHYAVIAIENWGNCQRYIDRRAVLAQPLSFIGFNPFAICELDLRFHSLRS